MRIKILQGSEAGHVQDHPDNDPWAENAVQTGYAELAPEVVELVPEVGDILVIDTVGSDGDVTTEVRVIGRGDLASLTVAELEDVGDDHGIEAKDIKGTGGRGRVVRADWLRALAAHV